MTGIFATAKASHKSQQIVGFGATSSYSHQLCKAYGHAARKDSLLRIILRIDADDANRLQVFGFTTLPSQK
jgi:hypothetical protein